MAKTNQELTEKINSVQTAKPRAVATTIYDTLTKMKPQLQMALPAGMSVERLTRTALTVIRTTPKLLQCSTESLCAAVMQSAQLGLEPGMLGHCYFVPFFNGRRKQYEVTFIIGYRGLIQLARRSKRIKTIQASAIYENDDFDYELGSNARLFHKRPFGKELGKMIGAYAHVTYVDGGEQFEVMSKSEIDSIRARSKAKDSGPWVTDYDEMAKKTVFRRLAKYLELTIEISEAIHKDEAIEYAEEQPIEIELGELPNEEEKPEALDVEAPSADPAAATQEEIIPS